MQVQLRDRSQCPRVMFLHGGPGFSAELERRQYGERLPVHWWDQPRVAADAAQPFDTLVTAARAELVALSERRGAPIALLASSFGAFLAHELLVAVPQRIESVTFSAGILEMRLPFVRLGRRLGRQLSNTQLQAASQEAEASTDRQAFWTLFGQIAAVPNLFDHYWGPSSTQQRAVMRTLAAEGPLFDLPTVQAVMNELLSREVWAPIRAGVPARVLIGRYDPLAEESDVARWHTLLPAAAVELVDCGHFPHLELVPDTWMP